MRKTLKVLFFISACTSTLLSASPLKSDEYVLFLPSIAYIKDQKLHIEVDVWVYEKQKRPGFNTVLSKYMGVKIADLPQAQQNYFKEQTALFKVDSERNKQISVQFANGDIKELAKTNRAGRSDNTFIFDLNAIPQLQKSNQRIPFTLHSRADISSYALFSPDEGYLIISDIDDTIKDSSVLDTKTLLRNTFLHAPKVAHDMPEKFQKLQEDLPNPLFVYVSSSPIQLFPVLSRFIDEHYPKGVIKLRQSTAWNEVIASKEDSIAHKKSTITQLLNAYPNKKVILFGDSGENDPEIYLDIGRQYPDRITEIYIRDVTNEAKNSPRYQNFPYSKLTIIHP